MKKKLSYIGYLLAYASWFLLSLLPLGVLYVLSDLLCFFISRIVRYRHQVIWANLISSFPDKNEAELKHIEHDFYSYFCDYLVETIKLMTMSRNQLHRRMVFTGIEEVNRCVDNGQSCAVYLGHYGNWEWITSLPLWTSAKGQCCQVYHPLENEKFDHLFRTVRQRLGALCIPMAETLRRIVDFKRQGQPIIIGYIADQAPFWNNIHHWLPFLNHDTPVLTGSERIIKKTGQAVFYGDVSRTSRGHYRCELRLVTKDARQWPDWQVTDRYFELLQQTICRQPELYLWSHKRWKRSHEEFDLRYDKVTGRVSLEQLDVIKKRKGLQ